MFCSVDVGWFLEGCCELPVSKGAGQGCMWNEGKPRRRLRRGVRNGEYQILLYLHRFMRASQACRKTCVPSSWESQPSFLGLIRGMCPAYRPASNTKPPLFPMLSQSRELAGTTTTLLNKSCEFRNRSRPYTSNIFHVYEKR